MFLLLTANSYWLHQTQGPTGAINIHTLQVDYLQMEFLLPERVITSFRLININVINNNIIIALINYYPNNKTNYRAQGIQ